MNTSNSKPAKSYTYLEVKQWPIANEISINSLESIAKAYKGGWVLDHVLLVSYDSVSTFVNRLYAYLVGADVQSALKGYLGTIAGIEVYSDALAHPNDKLKVNGVFVVNRPIA